LDLWVDGKERQFCVRLQLVTEICHGIKRVRLTKANLSSELVSNQQN